MRIIKEMMIIGLAVLALIYLGLPSFLPDFLPMVGWIDEGIATTILLNTFAYYGINLTSLYGRSDDRKRKVRRIVHEEQPPTIEEPRR